MPAPPALLQPADLARLRRMVFSPRGRAEGVYAGLHASAQRGRGVEFSDYREYTPGDPPGDVDWKVYARSDRMYIRLFEHQSDLAVTLVVDGSGSMGYGGAVGRGRGAEGPRGQGKYKALKIAVSSFLRFPWAPIPFDPSAPSPPPSAPSSKYVHAARLAAAVAFLITQQGDKAGLAVARGGLRNYHPPRGKYPHLRSMLAGLEAVVPEGPADLPATLDPLVRLLPRRGVLIVLSDFLDDRDATLASLMRHVHRGGEVILFQVLHPDELDLPDLGNAVVIDSETGQRIKLNTPRLQRSYAQKMRSLIDSFRAACHARGIDHNLVNTATPYQATLERYLVRRVAQR